MAKEMVTVCDYCGTPHILPELPIVDGKEIEICEECRDRFYTRCDDCQCYHKDENFYKSDWFGTICDKNKKGEYQILDEIKEILTFLGYDWTIEKE